MRQSILKLDKHEVFELVEALYTFCILNHSGQWSELYSIQSQISNVYSPSHSFSESEVQNENYFYSEITEDNAQYIWNRVEYYLDNKWNE